MHIGEIKTLSNYECSKGANLKQTTDMKTPLALAATVAMTGGALAQDAFENAIRPITAPTIFDSALPRTHLHGFYMHQSMPSSVNTTLGQVALGGSFDVYALQFEIALNERTSIVATKDGYIDFNPDNTLSNQSGFANLGLGLKHAFIYQPENQYVLSGIGTVEIPTGNSDVWQGEGDGAINLNLAALKLHEGFQFAGNLGVHIPFDNSQSLTGSLSLHASYEITPWFIPLVELNWFHTFDAGDGDLNFIHQGSSLVPSVAQFEGGDLINLGSSNASENRDTVILGLGFRSRLCNNATLGFAYEMPLTEDQDGLMDERITLDFVIKF